MATDGVLCSECGGHVKLKRHSLDPVVCEECEDLELGQTPQRINPPI